MRYFVDTEFIERGPDEPISLISIGIICDDGLTYYAENGDADLGRANDWVKEHVIPHLVGGGAVLPREKIAADILAFIGGDTPEFWGWCCGFDYVLLSQLIGFANFPEGWPFYFRDIQQLADESGLSLSSDDAPPERWPHNALADARHIKTLFSRLNNRQPPKEQ